MPRLRLGLATCALAAAALPAVAGADVLAGPDATKLCAGYDGGGISWSIGLNEDWRPSPHVHYRVTLVDPRGRRLGFSDGSVGGYWDEGNLAQGRDSAGRTEASPRAGTYRFRLELKVDPQYPDLGVGTSFWLSRAGRWVARTWLIRVYDCR